MLKKNLAIEMYTFSAQTLILFTCITYNRQTNVENVYHNVKILVHRSVVDSLSETVTVSGS